MKYETIINGKRIEAEPENRFHPNHSCGTLTPGFTVRVGDEPPIRLQIDHQSFDGNCIGGDECREYVDYFLTNLGFTRIEEPAPTLCPTCGAAT